MECPWHDGQNGGSWMRCCTHNGNSGVGATGSRSRQSQRGVTHKHPAAVALSNRYAVQASMQKGGGRGTL
eukprot:361144-Chlamydomonas_euryale.AAC.3